MLQRAQMKLDVKKNREIQCAMRKQKETASERDEKLDTAVQVNSAQLPFSRTKINSKCLYFIIFCLNQYH